ncbi:TrbG/VirB9 family P-type conjugative transfer protein, partial [Bordetella hinzii]|nr:TrbG/VirB9 family P-type conjugative transfer protein [Bordetella hinzii]
MFVALLLSGCQAASSAHWRVAPDHFDFNWQLSGDPEVAPLQVFAGGQEIWLQFAPGQELPAIFGQAPAGEQPLAYQ